LDLNPNSEKLHKKMIDLNGDGLPEVVAQGMIGCGATGNCPFGVLRKAKQGYELILKGEAQTFTIQKSNSNGFHVDEAAEAAWK
jgi:hypothetical protein